MTQRITFINILWSLSNTLERVVLSNQPFKSQGVRKLDIWIRKRRDYRQGDYCINNNQRRKLYRSGPDKI